MKFTIRDVLWLTVVIAVAVAWKVDRRGYESSPMTAWLAVVDAMKQGDERRLQQVCTAEGLASLKSSFDATRMRAVGSDWETMEMRWPTFHNQTTVAASGGPLPKECALVFTKTTKGWKLSRWIPGY